MGTKVCRQCKEEKDLDQFSKMKAAKDGKQHECKACNKINNAKFRKNRPKYMLKYYKTEKGRQNVLEALATYRHKEGGGLYKVTNKQTGTIYIGSSTQISRRRTEWVTYMNNPEQHSKYLPERLKQDILQYGVEAFTWEVIEKLPGMSKKEITGKEYEIIKMLEKLKVDIYNIQGTVARLENNS